LIGLNLYYSHVVVVEFDECLLEYHPDAGRVHFFRPGGVHQGLDPRVDEMRRELGEHDPVRTGEPFEVLACEPVVPRVSFLSFVVEFVMVFSRVVGEGNVRGAFGDVFDDVFDVPVSRIHSVERIDVGGNSRGANLQDVGVLDASVHRDAPFVHHHSVLQVRQSGVVRDADVHVVEAVRLLVFDDSFEGSYNILKMNKLNKEIFGKSLGNCLFGFGKQ